MAPWGSRPAQGAALVAALSLLLVGCGSETPGSSERQPAADGEWTTAELSGDPGADSPIVLAVDGDDMVTLSTSDAGAVQGHVSLDGDDFRAGEPLETGLDYLWLAGATPHGEGWYALGSGGLTEVDGDEELMFEATGLRSDDGLVWEAVTLEGFAGPADIASIVEVNGVLVAAGAYREAGNPSMGGFRAMTWRSEDGRTWTEVGVPITEGADSFVADLDVSGDRLLAAGGSDDRAALWTSDDAGATWTAVSSGKFAGVRPFTAVAAAGDEVVLGGTDADGPAYLRSTDAGETWTRAIGPPPSEHAEEWAPVWAGGGQFFTVVSAYIESWSDPAVCYADLALCAGGSSASLYASDDGDSWSRVDSSGLGDDVELDEVTGTEDGRVIALRGEGSVSVATWPGGVDLPLESEPVTPSVELVEVPEGQTPEQGVRYHAPLYAHCGMDWLYLGGVAWKRSDDGPDVETGAGDEFDPSWPVVQQTIFGFATLVEPGVVEYSIGEGEVIATYRSTDEQPPGCD